MRIGDVFAQISEPRRAWEVVRVVPMFDGIPHAALECLDDRKTTKLLSCLALMDRRKFTHVPRQEETGGALVG